VEEEEEEKAKRQLKEAETSVPPSPPTGDGEDSEKNAAASTASAHGAEPIAEDVAASGASEGSGESAVVSEYAKWMEGADTQLGSSGEASTRTEEPPTEDELDGLEPSFQHSAKASARSPTAAPAKETPAQGILQRVRAKLSGLWASILGKGKTKLERARDSAEEVHKLATAKLVESQRRLEELEGKVSGSDPSMTTSENVLAYSTLEGRCVSKSLAEYKYEVCFFKDAKQDSVDIGSWKRWEAPHVGIFDGGRWCPGGPERSLRVFFSCGPKEEIEDVSEPSRCTYEAKITHPAACTQEALQALERSRGPRRPMDEL